MINFQEKLEPFLQDAWEKPGLRLLLQFRRQRSLLFWRERMSLQNHLQGPERH